MSEFGYNRIVEVFDKDETAGQFLREDGEGGFSSGVYRMAREIERLRASNADLLEALQEYVRDFGDNEDIDSQRMATKARTAIAKATGNRIEKT